MRTLHAYVLLPPLFVYLYALRARFINVSITRRMTVPSKAADPEGDVGLINKRTNVRCGSAANSAAVSTPTDLPHRPSPIKVETTGFSKLVQLAE